MRSLGLSVTAVEKEGKANGCLSKKYGYTVGNRKGVAYYALRY